MKINFLHMAKSMAADFRWSIKNRFSIIKTMTTPIGNGKPLPHYHSYGSVSDGSNFAKATSDKSADRAGSGAGEDKPE